MKHPLILLISSLMIGVCAQAETVEQVISLARKQLAPEKVLNDVKTLQYEGTVTNADGTKTQLTLVFKQPYMQLLKMITDAGTETTAVNGYEGWREFYNAKDPLRSGVIVLPPNQVQYLLSNAMENLYFFEGPDHMTGGKVELLGADTKNGKDCWKVAFKYPSGLQYTRFFEKGTGNLVATTSSDSNMEMIEKETLVSGGIKFPKTVDTYRDGELIRSVEFNTITVNAKVEDSVFDFPAIPTGKSALIKQ